MPIEVELARVGERVEKFALEDGAKVKDLLRVAGVELYEGETLQINGTRVDKETQLRDGDRERQRQVYLNLSSPSGLFIIPPATSPKVIDKGIFYCKDFGRCYRILYYPEIRDYDYELVDCENCPLYNNGECPLENQENYKPRPSLIVGERLREAKGG